MRFWDSSAVVPLLVAESKSRQVLDLARADRDLIVWWGTPIECASALARSERQGLLIASDANVAFQRLRHFQVSWAEVNPSARVRETSFRLLRTHALRSADSLQLAAALVAADGEPASLDFVCLDDRLTAAAQREGFTVVDWSTLE